MRSPSSYVLVTGTATVFPAGTAPRLVNGATVQTRIVGVGTLSVLIALALTTNTLTGAGRWQVSANGTDWTTFGPSNNAANVVIATGTGTGATTTVALEAPMGVYAWPFVRFQAYTGVASADGTADAATVSYRFLKDRR